MTQVLAFTGLPLSGRTTVLNHVKNMLVRKGRSVKILPMNNRDLAEWRSDARLFLFKHPEEGIVLLDDVENNIQAVMIKEMRGKVIEIERYRPCVIDRELISQTIYNTGDLGDLQLNIQYRIDTGLLK